MKIPRPHKKSRFLIIVLLLILACAGSLSAHKLRALKRNYADFHCYYLAGGRMLHRENIYVPRDTRAAEFRYAPIFGLIMSAFALTNEDTADTLWYLINFCLLIISFLLLKKMVIPETLSFKTGLLLYILLILGTLRLILHNFDSGQVNIIILGSTLGGLYLMRQKREALGSAIFAFSCLIKYTPLIFIPYFIFRRKFKLSLMITGFILIYLALPALCLGPKADIVYLRNLYAILTQSTILEPMTILDPKNQSLLSMWQRFFTPCIAYFHAPPMPLQALRLNPGQITSISIISAIILYGLILYFPKRREGEAFCENIDYALLLICVILFNLNAWMHNYLLLSLGYFILLYYLLKKHFRDKVIGGLLLLSFLLNLITLKPILGKIWAYKINFYSPFTLSALLTFVALLKIKFSQGCKT